MLLAATCLIALASTLVPGGFWRGLVIGALGASALAAMFVLVLESTGTAPRAMGATAEEWTAGELRKLRRQGWTLVNHFGLGYGDIDHIVIGRAAIFVVETKWSASGWGRPNTTLEDTVAQVTKAARSVRLWTRAESLGLPVVPVVFLWGGADGHTLPVSERFDHDGVRVIRGGKAARAWRADVEQMPPVVSAEAADAVVERVREHLEGRDRHEAAEHPVPPSIDHVLSVSFGAFAAGVAGILTILEPLSAGWRWPVVPIAAAAVVAGVVLRRYRALCYFADAWLAGVAGMGVLSVLLLAIA
ncbi:MAG TPA: nuclease-related domain-containing protein [Jatrophihabitans sp.]